jgi:NADPH-dependent glutamate synthase beta subunit-like oxidoreductase
MPEDRGTPDIAHGVPPIAVSTGSTLANRTGSWKYIQPIYQDRVAPCNAHCPVGIDVEGWMDLLRQGKVAEARDLLVRENPMPAVTGRVCDHPCESACNRAAYDEAVSIRSIERMLGDLAPAEVAPAAARTRKERVAVIGSGPAGLACAYHLARMGYAVNVFEADDEPGGWLRYGIPEYRLPRAVLAHEIERIRGEGVIVRCGARVGDNLAWREIEAHDAVFLATGARVSRPFAWSGHDVAGVRPGPEFLHEYRGGARVEVGRRVVVVGGTDTAVDCARTALRLGAEVTVLVPEAREAMPAHADAVAQAIAEGVRFEFLTTPVRAQSSEHAEDEQALDAIGTMYDEGDGPRPSARLVGVECVRLQPAAGDAPALPVQGGGFFLPADTLLTALGEEPDFGFLPADITRRGFVIRADELGRTSRPGFFAGGDVTGERRTVAHSLGAGKRAAIGIDRWLREKAGETLPPLDLAALRYGGVGNVSVTRWRGDDPVHRTNELNEMVPFDMLNMAHFPKVPRNPDRLRPADELRSGFDEANLGLSTAAALAEAKRCFNCGVCNMCGLCMVFCPDVAIKPHASGHGYSLSYKYCKGCGVCVEECPRGAMTMTREGL